MKKLILPISLFASLFVSSAFTGSDPCDGNELFVKGTVSKTGYYKADGTQTGTGTSTVSDITTSGDSTIATISTSYTDAKHPDKTTDGSMRMICVDGKLMMDMSGMINSMTAASGKDMKVVMTGNMVPYKTSYTAGEKLDDINMNMEVYNKGTLMMTSLITITDRVVLAVEDKTTPAGTFHCYKISEITTTNSKMSGMNMPGNGPMKSIQWFSPKDGVVRLESYKDDKLASYNELLSIVKP